MSSVCVSAVWLTTDSESRHLVPPDTGSARGCRFLLLGTPRPDQNDPPTSHATAALDESQRSSRRSLLYRLHLLDGLCGSCPTLTPHPTAFADETANSPSFSTQPCFTRRFKATMRSKQCYDSCPPQYPVYCATSSLPTWSQECLPNGSSAPVCWPPGESFSVCNEHVQLSS